MYRNQAERVFNFAKEKYQLPDDILSQKLGVSVDEIEKIIGQTVDQSGLNGKTAADAMIKIIEKQFAERISLDFDGHLVLIYTAFNSDFDRTHFCEIFLNTPKGKYRVEALISHDVFTDLEHRVIYNRLVNDAQETYRKNEAL